MDVKQLLTMNNLIFDDDSEFPLLRMESSNQKTRADFPSPHFHMGKIQEKGGKRNFLKVTYETTIRMLLQ